MVFEYNKNGNEEDFEKDFIKKQLAITAITVPAALVSTVALGTLEYYIVGDVIEETCFVGCAGFLLTYHALLNKYLQI